MNDMDDQQAQFAINYIKNGRNAYKAALDAGYSPKHAKANSYTIVNQPAVKQALRKALVKAERKLSATYEYKIKKLMRVINTYIPDEGELNNNEVKTAISAITELNKMHGDYAPDKRLSLTVDATKDRVIEATKVYEEF